MTRQYGVPALTEAELLELDALPSMAFAVVRQGMFGWHATPAYKKVQGSFGPVRGYVGYPDFGPDGWGRSAQEAADNIKAALIADLRGFLSRYSPHFDTYTARWELARYWKKRGAAWLRLQRMQARPANGVST